MSVRQRLSRLIIEHRIMLQLTFSSKQTMERKKRLLRKERGGICVYSPGLNNGLSFVSSASSPQTAGKQCMCVRSAESDVFIEDGRQTSLGRCQPNSSGPSEAPQDSPPLKTFLLEGTVTFQDQGCWGQIKRPEKIEWKSTTKASLST